MFKILIFGLHIQENSSYLVMFLSPQSRYRVAAQFSKSLLCCLGPFLPWATLGLTPILALIYTVVRLSSLCCVSVGVFCTCGTWICAQCQSQSLPIQDFLTPSDSQRPFSLFFWTERWGAPRIFPLHLLCWSEWLSLSCRWNNKEKGRKK